MDKPNVTFHRACCNGTTVVEHGAAWQHASGAASLARKDESRILSAAVLKRSTSGRFRKYSFHDAKRIVVGRVLICVECWNDGTLCWWWLVSVYI